MTVSQLSLCEVESVCQSYAKEIEIYLKLCGFGWLVCHFLLLSYEGKYQNGVHSAIGSLPLLWYRARLGLLGLRSFDTSITLIDAERDLTYDAGRGRSSCCCFLGIFAWFFTHNLPSSVRRTDERSKTEGLTCVESAEFDAVT